MKTERRTNTNPATTYSTSEVQIKRHAVLPWQRADEIFMLRIQKRPDLFRLYEDEINRRIIKEYYEAQADVASGEGSDKLIAFTRNHPLDPTSTTEDAIRVDQLIPHFKIARQILGLERQRTSKGFAKHERIRKAGLRR